jgi:hypothetical protein
MVEKMAELTKGLNTSSKSEQEFKLTLNGEWNTELILK